MPGRYPTRNGGLRTHHPRTGWGSGRREPTPFENHPRSGRWRACHVGGSGSLPFLFLEPPTCRPTRPLRPSLPPSSTSETCTAGGGRTVRAWMQTGRRPAAHGAAGGRERLHRRGHRARGRPAHQLFGEIKGRDQGDRPVGAVAQGRLVVLTARTFEGQAYPMHVRRPDAGDAARRRRGRRGAGAARRERDRRGPRLLRARRSGGQPGRRARSPGRSTTRVTSAISADP